MTSGPMQPPGKRPCLLSLNYFDFRLHSGIPRLPWVAGARIKTDRRANIQNGSCVDLTSPTSGRTLAALTCTLSAHAPSLLAGGACCDCNAADSGTTEHFLSQVSAYCTREFLLSGI